MRKHPKLDHGARADTFTQLGTMLNAGLPLDQALTTIAMGDDNAARVATAMLPIVRSGQSLTASGTRAGLIDRFDRELLSNSETSGRVGPTLIRLGQWYADKASRARQIKSKLALPVGILTLAAFLPTLPALIGGSISGFEYLIGVLWFLGRIAALGWVLWQLPAWIRDRGDAHWLDALRIQMPVFGHMHVRREALSVLDAFEMMYTAGVDANRALTVAIGNTTNGIIRNSFDDSRARLEGGVSLGDAFASVAHLPQRTRSFITTGDSSGTLTDMLQRNSQLERDDIDRFDAQVADWVPRLVYAAVAAWMISKILGA